MNSADFRKYIMGELSPYFEVYDQGKYLYSYIRAEGGSGNECNIFTFPSNYAASISIALTFMNEWKKRLNTENTTWLSKDLIILFYDDMSELKGGQSDASSVKEFLN